MILKGRAVARTIALSALGILAGCTSAPEPQGPPPNIVFLIADDWSAPHAGALGDRVVQTPTFDQLCAEGTRFENAFVSAPSCSPARAAILAGQNHWRLGGAANLWGSIAADTPLFTDILRTDGYLVGKFGKSHWPSHHRHRAAPLPKKHERFAKFLARRKPGQPFFYWYGGQDPHRPYELGIGTRSGLDPKRVEIPAGLPDTPVVRADICDYYWEVQRFDRQCGEILRELERIGELANTIVVMTSDNGMPFPRCKATLYDMGTKVPLVVRWPNRIATGRTVTDFVALQDFAPTFLESAGLRRPASMNARSLLSVLLSKHSGRVDPTRDHVLTGMEGHVEDNPQRAIRTDRFLLIRNDYEGAWPVHPKSDYNFNIDPSPTKTEMMRRRTDPAVHELYRRAFEARPERELYDLAKDPQQLVDVARDPAYAADLQRLSARLHAGLVASEDPRETGNPGSFRRHREADQDHARRVRRR